MSEIKVNSIKGVGASAAAITVNNTDGTCTANITNRTNKNLILNGAFQIAQRSTSSTSEGYQTVDRFQFSKGGTDETPQQAQVDVASGATPYTLGFRKAFKVTNGNQTSGVGATDFVIIQTKLEAQDIANSGWNYLSSSSYITFSFWIKSSVAQSFQFVFKSIDVDRQLYLMETGSLTADTWTKVTKTIPGNSNLAFDNDANQGLQINLVAYSGSSYANDSGTVNAWQTYASGIQFGKASTSTWYTTNDATLEITGVQLEVGPVVTPFEHRSFGDELLRCQRYYHVLIDGDNTSDSFGNATCYNSSSMHFVYQLHPQMRATPTLDYTTGSNYYKAFQNNTDDAFDTWALVGNSHPRAVDLMASSGVSVTSGASALLRINNGSAKIRFTAEL